MQKPLKQKRWLFILFEDRGMLKTCWVSCLCCVFRRSIEGWFWDRFCNCFLHYFGLIFGPPNPLIWGPFSDPPKDRSCSRLGSLKIALQRPGGDRPEVRGRSGRHLSLARAPGERHYQRLPTKSNKQHQVIQGLSMPWAKDFFGSTAAWSHFFL